MGLPAPPEPPAWESGPQPWDAGRQGWDSAEIPRAEVPRAEAPRADWDAPSRSGRWEDAPREREQRWTPEPEPPAWDSGPQAWDGRGWDGPPQAQPPARELPRPEPVRPEPARGEPAEPPNGRSRRERPAPEPAPRAAAAAAPVRERPTDHIPRIRDEDPPDVGLTRPIQAHRAPADEGYGPDDYEPDDDDGPPTMVGAAPAGAEAWHRERTRRRGAPADDDGGPPTEAAGPIDFDDAPAGLGGRRYDQQQGDSFSDGFEDFYGTGTDLPVYQPQPPRPERAGRRRGEPEPEPDGFLDSGESEPIDDDEPEEPRKGLLGRVGDSASQAWAAVLAQWIAGAVGGAALWVGFRFLWRSLPVVAIAAAALVTVGLVVVVRALLRNDDMRTTMFAVLVGLLLTVSPAILVLLGR
ncbi:hypothetical protein BJF78_03345 [Pseudonocardia sp. CNS-139]|nr:hypothetical protein BJF78_03345 [Pseudonocardia sp. CNS-139]